ncbi:SgcJ/EcaC family oxidoreductase [Streptomyces gobiensis]|uniref:SgcJ/EcaC family oxidoreductase n=1 Tax=Streptomyces gobiensis TaxID=2875706 RepID=UPI001E3AA73B|nr:SgcJ/EcaC family oxidoreductase [Streptomyces gobiensis]UGY93937.1 SgcJ/EcaC family oxidoreductase [Streptomyces gobiensis]
MSDEEIRTVFAAMAAAWARSDAKEFAQAFTEDADFTSVRGDHVYGSAQIALAHARLFTTQYADTRLEPTVRRISRPRPDIVIAHVDNRLLRADGTATHMHAQAVLENRPEGWKILSFLNMVPLPAQS